MRLQFRHRHAIRSETLLPVEQRRMASKNFFGSADTRCQRVEWWNAATRDGSSGAAITNPNRWSIECRRKRKAPRIRERTPRMPDRTKCFYGRGVPPDARFPVVCMCEFRPRLVLTCTRLVRAGCPFFRPASVPNAIPADRKGDDRHADTNTIQADNGMLLAMHR